MQLTVVDQWHQEICDASTSIAPSTNQRIGRTNDILIEKSCGPHLARHKSSSEDADKEPKCDESRDVTHEARQGCRDGSKSENSNVRVSWAPSVAGWAGKKSYEERSCQSCDV